MNRHYENIALWALVIIAALPAMLQRDFTPDNELRYLSIANEALTDGHCFAFYNQGMPYADKPPLYLWIVMLGKLLFGRHVMLFLSMFSIIPALVITTLMDKWTAKYTGLSADTRLTGKLMMMTSGLFLGLALTIRMDMLMCMFITLSLYTFYKMYMGDGTKADRWLFPIYIFLGIFTKGPVAILVPLLSIPVFLLTESRIKTLGRYWGWRTWLTLLALCAVWFGCVYAEGGTSYLENLLFNQTVNRAVDSFHHKAPFYYYLTSYWYSLAPWSILIVWYLASKHWVHKTTDRIERFYICVALTTTVMLSLISSKIAVYLAPTFPFFVYTAVISVEKRGWSRRAAASLAIPTAIFALALPAVAVVMIKRVLPIENELIYAGAVLTGSAVAALVWLYRRKSIRGAINCTAAGLLVGLFIAGMAMPKFNDGIGFRNVCNKALEMGAGTDATEYVCFGIRRPESMDVFLGKDVRIINDFNELTMGYDKGCVLIAKTKKVNGNDDIKRLIGNKPQEIVGDYIVVRL